MKWKLKCNEIEWNGNYHSLNGSIFKFDGNRIRYKTHFTNYILDNNKFES